MPFAHPHQQESRSPLATEGCWCSRLVVEDLLDVLHHIVRELGHKLHGRAVVLDLRSLGGTQDHRADIGVLDTPRQAELRDSAAKLLGDLRELADFGNLRLAFVGLQALDGTLEEALVGGEARVLRNAVVVLASEQTGCEWRPDRGAVLELLVQRRVFDLESLAVESVILRLFTATGSIMSDSLLLGWRDESIGRNRWPNSSPNVVKRSATTTFRNPWEAGEDSRWN